MDACMRAATARVRTLAEWNDFASGATDPSARANDPRPNESVLLSMDSVPRRSIAEFSAVDLFRDGRRARGELRRCDHGLTERTVSGGERLVTQRLRPVTQRLRPVTQRLRPVTQRIGPVVRRLAPAARSIVRRSMGGDFRSDEDDSSGAATESRGKRMDLSLGEPRFDVTSRNGHAVPATGHPRKSSLSRMVGSTS